MLYVVVILSLMSVALGEDKRPTVHLPPLILKVVKDAASDCIKETGAGQEAADNFFKLNFNNDENSKKFLYCIATKTNYADEDGHLNDGFLSLFGDTDLKDGVKNVIATCNKQQEPNKIDTMQKTTECFYANTPVVLVV